MAASRRLFAKVQPAPGDTATFLNPKYRVTRCDRAMETSASLRSPSAELEHAVAAARVFNQVEAAAAGFCGQSDDNGKGISSCCCLQSVEVDSNVADKWCTDFKRTTAPDAFRTVQALSD